MKKSQLKQIIKEVIQEDEDGTLKRLGGGAAVNITDDGILISRISSIPGQNEVFLHKSAVKKLKKVLDSLNW